MKYPLVFYTDDLPENVGGRANGPVIRIKTKYREDEGIYRHELCHVKQWFITLGLHSLLYPFARWYRLLAETQAYAEQMDWPDRNGIPITLSDAASRLAAPLYNLGISESDASIALTKRRNALC